MTVVTIEQPSPFGAVTVEQDGQPDITIENEIVNMEVVLEQIAMVVVEDTTGANYVHTQDVPATQWDVHHNLGFLPNVGVVDSLLRVVEAGIEHVDVNYLKVLSENVSTGQATCS